MQIVTLNLKKLNADPKQFIFFVRVQTSMNASLTMVIVCTIATTRKLGSTVHVKLGTSYQTIKRAVKVRSGNYLALKIKTFLYLWCTEKRLFSLSRHFYKSDITFYFF